MRRATIQAVLLAIAAASFAPVATAEEPPITAADVTEPGRRLARALDLVLDPGVKGPGVGAAEGKRTIVLVVDPTPSLVSAGFGDALEAAIARHAARLAEAAIGVCVTGTKGALALPPTSDAAAVVRAVRDALAVPRNGFQNLYEDVRGAAAAIAPRAGARDVVVVSLENGDLEDDVEATVKALEKAHARAFAIAKEAFLSDSYWSSHAGKATPKGTRLAGSDAPFVEVPWGFLFQFTHGNEAAPSGFATYGLTRLAAATGGRVFLVAEGGGTKAHTCSVGGVCPFCTGDHVAPYGVYASQRLKALAPLATSREDAYGIAAKDPCFRAVLAAWEAAAAGGLVRSRPGLALSGGTLVPDKRMHATWAPLTGNSLAFVQLTAAAEKALAACDGAIAGLEKDLAKAGEGGVPRWRAMADLTRVMLWLTRTNLVAYVGFCQDAGPTIVGKKPRPQELAAPEQPLYDSGYRFVGLSYANLGLCHGVAPYRDVHLGGGAALRTHLDALDSVVSAFLAKYEGTPYSVAIRRMAIARFVPTVQGKVLPPPDRKLPGSTTEGGGATGDRPAREGGGGSTGGGATTDGR